MNAYIEALGGEQKPGADGSSDHAGDDSGGGYVPTAAPQDASDHMALPVASLDKLFTPVLIGGYAVIGLYIGRNMFGSKGTLPWSSIALVAGTSAASAYAASYVTPMVVCPRSPSAPLVEAAISSAISWQLLAFSSGTESAMRFVPVQLGAHIAGKYIAPKLFNPLHYAT